MAVEGSGMVTIHPSLNPLGLVPCPTIVSPSSEMLVARISVQPVKSNPKSLVKTWSS